MCARSTAITEMEAIEWASRGLVRLKDVTSGTRGIQSHIAFRREFDTLDHTLLLAVREGMPEAWQAALRDGSAVARDETRRLTRLLASEGGDAEGPREQQYAVQRPQTLVTRPPTPVARLRVRHVYDAMTAAVFTFTSGLRSRPWQCGAARAHLRERACRTAGGHNRQSDPARAPPSGTSRAARDRVLRRAERVCVRT